jgi:hypothetical protein
MKDQIEVIMTSIRALTTAQGAGGMGPAHGQAMPEAPGALCWADTCRQRSDEDIREYFSRAWAELGNLLKESAPLLYGETFTPLERDAAFSIIRDHAVKEEKRGIQSNDHAAFSIIRDHAVKEENHAAFSAIRDHAVKEEKREMKSNDHASLAPSETMQSRKRRGK